MKKIILSVFITMTAMTNLMATEEDLLCKQWNKSFVEFNELIKKSERGTTMYDINQKNMLHFNKKRIQGNCSTFSISDYKKHS